MSIAFSSSDPSKEARLHQLKIMWGSGILTMEEYENTCLQILREEPAKKVRMTPEEFSKHIKTLQNMRDKGILNIQEYAEELQFAKKNVQSSKDQISNDLDNILSTHASVTQSEE